MQKYNDVNPIIGYLKKKVFGRNSYNIPIIIYKNGAIEIGIGILKTTVLLGTNGKHTKLMHECKCGLFDFLFKNRHTY